MFHSPEAGFNPEAPGATNADTEYAKAYREFLIRTFEVSPDQAAKLGPRQLHELQGKLSQNTEALKADDPRKVGESNQKLISEYIAGLNREAE